MAERRPLVLLNGVLQELPSGESLSSYLATKQVEGVFVQIPLANDPYTEKALVLINGVIHEIPAGDTLAGISIVIDVILNDISSFTIQGLSKDQVLFSDISGMVVGGLHQQKALISDISSMVIRGLNNQLVLVSDVSSFVIGDS